MEMGMDDYLVKPVTAEQLAGVVNRLTQKEEPAEDAAGVDPLVLEGLQTAGLLDIVAVIFMRETPTLLAELRRSMEQVELTTLVEAAHRLKGSSMQLGAMALAKQAAAVQEIGETGTREGIPARVDEIEWEFKRVCGVLVARSPAARMAASG
jgi:hypothetical protein